MVHLVTSTAATVVDRIVPLSVLSSLDCIVSVDVLILVSHRELDFNGLALGSDRVENLLINLLRSIMPLSHLLVPIVTLSRLLRVPRAIIPHVVLVLHNVQAYLLHLHFFLLIEVRWQVVDALHSGLEAMQLFLVWRR